MNESLKDLLVSIFLALLILVIVIAISFGVIASSARINEKDEESITSSAETVLIIVDETRDKTHNNRLQSKTVYNKITGDTYIYTYSYDDSKLIINTKLTVINSKGEIVEER